MASSVKKPLQVALNRIYPASIYATAPVAPFVVGVNGAVGMAQRNLTQSFEQQLRQRAQSLMAVNSEQYIDDIRDQYGISDSGMYDTMGTIGGIVGTIADLTEKTVVLEVAEGVNITFVRKAISGKRE